MTQLDPLYSQLRALRTRRGLVRLGIALSALLFVLFGVLTLAV